MYGGVDALVQVLARAYVWLVEVSTWVVILKLGWNYTLTHEQGHVREQCVRSKCSSGLVCTRTGGLLSI